MLIKCPECELQVSDKAFACPHCGYPIKTPSTIPRKKSNKRRRLPNGFGQITELKGRYLRKPFRAMVTVGKDEKGKPICKLLKPDSYFETYNEAYEALVEYNKNPYSLESDITMNELFEKWKEEYFKIRTAPSTRRDTVALWRYCNAIHDMRVIDIRVRHIKLCMDEGSYEVNGVIKQPSAGIKTRMKSLFNMMLDYALEYGIVEKNYARDFAVPKTIIKEIKENTKSHLSFTDEEMKTMWNRLEVPYVSMILVQCYTGLRPKELCLLTLDDVDFDNWTFTGGLKTDAGRNRVVPIHEKIKDLVKNAYVEAKKAETNQLFFSTTTVNKELTYDKYKTRFIKTMKQLGLNPAHRPHDPRKQFITMAKQYNVDEYAIKRIVGHRIDDITEQVYTDRSIEWLHEEISKIQ